MKHLTRLASLTALAAGLGTAACNRDPAADNATAQAQFALPALPATLPLESGPAGEIGVAPSPSDLPDAPPLRLARVADADQAYGYADAAYGYDEAVGDAPPDYGFDYEGADPWAWQGYDDSLMVAEPIDDGYRYYYYRPGAAEPYFVRDPFYSYGFASGLLAVVYGADGGIVPYADYGPRLGYASRYYARGRQLWSVSRRAQRRPVIAATWLRQRPVILAARERWGAGRAHQPAWQRYYDTNRPRQVRYWQAEQVRRQADARRFDGWREQGFRTPPPPRAIPPAWQKASWARDDRRYRPAAEAVRDRRDDARGEQRRDVAQTEDRREARQDQPRRPDAVRDRPSQAERRDQVAEARAEQRAERQTQRPDRVRPSQPDRPRPDRPQREPDRQRPAADRRADQAQRQAERQAQRVERGRPDRPRADQPRPADRAERPRADRPQREQPTQRAERPRRDEAGQADRRQAQQAERQQRQRQQGRQPQQAAAQRREAQQADRQAERAQRQEAGQDQQRQAQQAARQQAQRAERQQAAQVPRQQAQAATRQQQQQQRQQQRQERRDARGPNPR